MENEKKWTYIQAGLLLLIIFVFFFNVWSLVYILRWDESDSLIKSIFIGENLAKSDFFNACKFMWSDFHHLPFQHLVYAILFLIFGPVDIVARGVSFLAALVCLYFAGRLCKYLSPKWFPENFILASILICGSPLLVAYSQQIMKEMISAAFNTGFVFYLLKSLDLENSLRYKKDAVLAATFFLLAFYTRIQHGWLFFTIAVVMGAGLFSLEIFKKRPDKLKAYKERFFISFRIIFIGIALWYLLPFPAKLLNLRSIGYGPGWRLWPFSDFWGSMGYVLLNFTSGVFTQDFFVLLFCVLAIVASPFFLVWKELSPAAFLTAFLMAAVFIGMYKHPAPRYFIQLLPFLFSFCSVMGIKFIEKVSERLGHKEINTRDLVMGIILFFLVHYLLFSPKASKLFWRYELSVYEWNAAKKYEEYAADDAISSTIQVINAEYNAKRRIPFIVTGCFNELAPSSIMWNINKRRFLKEKQDYGPVYFLSINDIMKNISQGRHFMLMVIFIGEDSLFWTNDYKFNESYPEEFYYKVSHNRKVAGQLINLIENKKIYYEKRFYDFGHIKMSVYRL